MRGAGGHDGGHGMAEVLDVAVVEEFHTAQVDLARLQRQGDKVAGGQCVVADGAQGLAEEVVDDVVFLAQDPGVIGVGRDALQAKEDERAQAGDVVVALRGRHHELRGLLQHPVDVVCRDERRAGGQRTCRQGRQRLRRRYGRCP